MVFDYSKAKFEIWNPKLKPGAISIYAQRYLLGELSLTLWVGGESDEVSYFEMLSRPAWFCVFADEYLQEALQATVSGTGMTPRLLRVTESPLLRELNEAEVFFEIDYKNLEHWVIIGTGECCHIVSDEEPQFRQL